MLRICIFALFLFAIVSCGGTDNGQTSAPQIAPDSPSTPSTSPSTWQEGLFSPSDDFHQICADPSKAYDKATAVQGTYIDENNWLRSFTYETYLWYDEVEDRDPACCSTPEYFELMKTFETTASGNPKDPFSGSQPTKEYLDSQRGVEYGYGFQVAPTQEAIFILYVEPSSPAYRAGLRRSMYISEIDDVPIEQLSVEQLYSALFPSEPERHSFTVLTVGDSQPRSVTMTSAEIATSPVLVVDTLVNRNSGHQVGYMLFNSHIPPAESALISAIRHFDFQDIDDLVLDLRYNGGGLVRIASQLAYMIAGPSATTGKLFEAFVTNGKIPPGNPFPFFPVSSDGLVLPSLFLERVFVLTGPFTCSASEAIINGLRGIDVEVVLIGGTTCGKPYGSVPEENCGTIYSIIQFRGVNDKGFGSYEDGFQPTCRARDDIRYPLGDPRENILGTALSYMGLNQCPASQQVNRSDEGVASEVPSDQLELPDIIETWPPIIPRRIVD